MMHCKEEATLITWWIAKKKLNWLQDGLQRRSKTGYIVDFEEETT